ncbi:MAG: hypothetical protein MR606_00460 [Mollicutes bacterium]|nr:hypothetical protein [Mollicutes bacterium]MDD7263733.1 hypothetical protein [bacterium]MDY4979811.1 hypothetical protein [Candidatus Onthovivens sp.]
MKKRMLTFLISIGLIACAEVGYSSWILSNNNSLFYEKNSSDKVAVCKIGSTYYTNIGKAIEKSVANDVIEVFPGNTDRNSLSYTITTEKEDKTLTIPQGVTLNIPYETGKANNKVASGTTGVHALANRATYCKSSVILGDGITLINNGTIEIGGYIGANAGGNPSGCTAEIIVN